MEDLEKEILRHDSRISALENVHSSGMTKACELEVDSKIEKSEVRIREYVNSEIEKSESRVISAIRESGHGIKDELVAVIKESTIQFRQDIREKKEETNKDIQELKEYVEDKFDEIPKKASFWLNFVTSSIKFLLLIGGICYTLYFALMKIAESGGIG